jgi:hypothetical protein
VAAEDFALIQELIGVVADDVPDEIMAWRVDVERPDVNPNARDASGAMVAAYSTVYRDLPCAHVSHGAEDRPEFLQEGIRRRHEFYFKPLADGNLPDVRERDRLVFGGRRLSIEAPEDLMEAGVLLVVKANERASE